MKVKELIDLLNKQNQEDEVRLEGCDCEGECIGVSSSADMQLLGYDTYRPNRVLIRRDGGTY